MKIPNLKSFSGRQLQTTITILIMLERAGYEVRNAREGLERWWSEERKAIRANRKGKVKPPESEKSPIKYNAPPVHPFLTCPACGRGKLQAKETTDPVTGEKFTYIACRECRVSAEFK